MLTNRWKKFDEVIHIDGTRCVWSRRCHLFLHLMVGCPFSLTLKWTPNEVCKQTSSKVCERTSSKVRKQTSNKVCEQTSNWVKVSPTEAAPYLDNNEICWNRVVSFPENLVIIYNTKLELQLDAKEWMREIQEMKMKIHNW